MTSPRAQHLQSQSPLQKKPVAWVVGNETDGVCDTVMEAADFTIQIPMQSVESLNVGVFMGISLYELRFKMVLLMLKEKIFDNFGRQVNVTGKMIQMAFDHNVQKVSELSGMQVIFLMILYCDQTMPLAQIGKDVGLFEDDLVQFLQPLQVKSLITEDIGGFHITVQGGQFLAEIWPIVEQTNTQLLDGFTQEERTLLDMFLKRLQKNCAIGGLVRHYVIVQNRT